MAVDSALHEVASVTRTAPLQIYLAREADPQAAVALGLVLVALAIVIVAVAARPGRRVVP